MVSDDDVTEILSALGRRGIATWIDGGWGIDALLAVQTRLHDDLDLVILRGDLAAARDAIAALGFAHAMKVAPGLPARLVLRDPHGRQVDFHPIVLDEQGGGWREIPGASWCHYPAADLRGGGTIDRRRVRCLTAELQVRHHLEYDPEDRDHLDMSRLADRFHLTLPAPYQERTAGPSLAVASGKDDELQ